MQVTRRLTSKPRRGGFTLIELLVVISIIAVLAALILPGIGAARETARRTQCMSQMRNVSFAFQTYATNNSGALPYLETWDPANVNAPSTSLRIWASGAAASPGRTAAPWSVSLLPYLEFQTLYDRLVTPGTGPEAVGTLQQTSIQVYTCPDDATENIGGNLSFAANGGYMTSGNWTAAQAGGLPVGSHTLNSYLFSFNNYNAAGTPANSPTLDSREVQAGTGLLVEETNSFGFRAQIDRIPDGQTHTVLLTENLQAVTWFNPSPTAVGVFVPVTGTAPGASTAGQYADAITGSANGIGPDPSVGGKSQSLFFGNALSVAAYAGTINSNLGAAEGTAPRPSSNHPNVVNVFFADGHGGPLSQNIADSVWMRLISSAGEKFGQVVLSDADF
ncbi:MAG: DUF1559 domain-containing protein [Planctomycetaceae bacterium]